jgi:hypothetical protein
MVGYAALCQEQNLVPIVEPEILMDGNHDIDRCFEVTEFTLRRVFAQLYLHRVQLEGTILKPNMIVPGKKAAKQAAPDEVAEMTIKCLRRAIRRRCPASSSCPAVSRTRRRPPISTLSTCEVPIFLGRCPPPMAGPFRTGHSRYGEARPRMNPPRRKPFSTAPT